jgi:hypothetical protein
MRTALYVLLALAMPVFAGQTVWKWVDDQGVTHFSDQPMPGATKMELNSSSRPSSEPAPAYTPRAPSKDIPAQKGPAYARFVIESPQQDESVINTGGQVRVRLASTPAIGGGQMVSLFLDGARVEGLSPSSMSFDLPNVPRGTHTLKAVVSNQDGVPLQETPPVTFHVRQESAAQPPVGPTLRNPPKPPSRTSRNDNKLRTSQPSYSALNGGPATIDPKTNMPPVAKPLPGGPRTGQ